MIRVVLLILAFLGLLAGPTLAADTGVSFATSANGAFGVCFGADMDETGACALDQCVKFSGEANCNTSLWCSTHTWTAAITITTTEGESYYDFLCNEPTAEKLQQVLDVSCNYEGYSNCAAYQIWDPDGNATLDQ